jgi:eukaryotic-like serine/threonine-protein kinase
VPHLTAPVRHDPDPYPGRVTQSAVLVAGRYRLDERIGAGAMGVVWRAIDERLGRTVAIKQLVVPPGLDDAAADEAAQRIRREARIAARLHHPNAVAVFDVADHEDRPWLVMEYLPSRSLATVLTERGPLPPLEVAAIGRQLADALTAAHAAGIVHRDVKPGNVLLAGDGTVKLTDFGISHAADDVTVTRTGVLAGTPAYLAPEVARGVYPTAASDVFALGATLYTAVEGQPPFGLNDNALALLHQVAAGVVRPPQQAGPLSALLMQLLRAEPAERPTMAHVRGMFARVLAGRPPADRNPQPVQPAAPHPAAPHPAPVATPQRSQPPAPPPTRVGLPAVEPAQPRRRLPVRMLALVGVLVVLTALLAFAALREQERPVADSAPTTSPPPAQVTSTVPPPTTTPARPPSAAELQQAVAAYYRLLPKDPKDAWTLLGPGLQARGFDSYERFWDQFERVQAQVLRADPATMTVRVVVVFQRKDRRPVAEVHDLTLIRGGGERLLINADERLGPTGVPGDDDDEDGNGNGNGRRGGGNGGNGGDG